MIPRLTPRRSPRLSPRLRVGEPTEFSDDSLSLSSPTTYSGPSQPQIALLVGPTTSVGPAPQSPSTKQQKIQKEEQHRSRLLSAGNGQSTVKSTSESPVPPPFLDHDLKSPIPSDSSSDFGSDSSSVTPPVTGPRPLVVSAKRLGQDVRRKHSKRRRCRSRRANNFKKQNGFCLWQVGNNTRLTTQEESDSSDDDTQDTQESLPFLFPHQELTPQEQKRQFWEWCYGNSTVKLPPKQKSWSANRAPPIKSCLSNPRPDLPQQTLARFKTPPATPKHEKRSRTYRVQFGSPKAVEYEIDGPAGKLTPLPSEVIRKRYSMEQKVETEAEVELTEETKVNSAVLAEWDDNFDRAETKASRRRKNRRSSSLFVPSPSLADDENEFNSSESSRSPEKLQPSATSPSVVVMKNLASLRMSPMKQDRPSPNELKLSPKAEEASILSKGKSPWPTPSPNQLSDMTSTPSPMHVDTSEFVVNLESFNVCGGAMATPPPTEDKATTPQRGPSSTQEQGETTPPPTNVSLETIHSVGGALDLESPASTSQPSPTAVAADSEQESHSSLSPIARMGQSPFSGRPNYKSGDIKKHAGRVEPIDFVKSLLDCPHVDQELDCFTVFTNLGKRQRAVASGAVMGSLEPFKNEIIPVLKDFVVELKRIVEEQDDPKLKNVDAVKHMLLREWKSIELDLFGRLRRTIDISSESAQELATKMKEESPRIQRSSKLLLRRTTQLEKEVSSLRVQLDVQRQKLRLINASHAPFAALTCLATCHLADFRLDDYTQDKLRIAFEHVVEAVETRIAFDLHSGTLNASVVSDSAASIRTAIPQNHLVSKFHQYFLNLMVEGKIPLLEEVQPLEQSDFLLQETIAAISLWLSRLDMATTDLLVVEKRCKSFVVDMPQVVCSLDDDTSIQLDYSVQQSYLNAFVPTNIFVKRLGTKKLVKKLPTSKLSTYLEELCDNIYAQSGCASA